jgi:predicted site-specific integrase-resolvase
MPDESPDDLISPPEVGRILCVSDETVRRWTKDGKLRHIPLPSGRVKYRRGDVLAMLVPVEPTEATA